MAAALVGSRLLVWAAALWSVVLFGVLGASRAPLDPAGLTQPFGSTAANLLVAPAARFDSVWYLAIAHGGYGTAPTTAFFPGYPLLIRGAGLVMPSLVVAGLLVSLASLVVASVLLWRLTALELGRAAARSSVGSGCSFPALFSCPPSTRSRCSPP